jgi:NIPSNAP
VNNLIELRQYLLHPGQRDTLIELFDAEFIETQEAVGMDVLGQFRDPQRPDYFVWLRGFSDLDARHESLTRFYDGPVWAEHRNAANATMIDSDNVMLLRSVTNSDALPGLRRETRDTQASTGLVLIVAEQVDTVDEKSIATFRSATVTRLEQSGWHSLGLYVTEPAPNTFTRLPIKTEPSIVWIGSRETNYETSMCEATYVGNITRQEHYVLIPTARSLLNGTTKREGVSTHGGAQ